MIIHLLAWFLVPTHQKYCPENNTLPTDGSSPDAMNSENLVTINPQKKQNDEKFIEELKKMIEYMCIGLSRLQDTYKTGNVVLALQYYINLMHDGLDGNFSLDRLPKCLLEDLDIDTTMKTKIRDMWTYERLHVVGDLYDNCFAELRKNLGKKTGIIDGYLLSIDSILSVYEKEFKTQLKQWG